jgi:putative transcriptional regulator
MKKKPANKKRTTPAGQSILRGLRQALDYERGKLRAKAEVYEVPPAVDVRKARAKTGLSQGEFANRYGFNRRSLQDWEQGRRTPDSAARAYLLVIAHNPEAVDKALFRKAS